MHTKRTGKLWETGFGWLWLGQAVTALGDRALGIALPYVVYQQTGSLTSTALLALSGYLPGLLFGSVAGVFADRWDRRWSLVTAQLLQGGIILLLLAASPERLWLTTAVVFAERTLSLLALPAGAALLPSLVGEAALARATARLSVATTTARLLGPVLGGALAAAVGMHGAVVLDAMSFFVAAALFSRLPFLPNHGRGPAPASLLASWRSMTREWKDGLRVIGQRRAIGTLFITLSLTSLGGTLVDPYSMGFVQGVLQANPAQVGLLSSAVGTGTLLGSLLSTWAVERFDLRRLVAVGTLLVGGLMLGLYHQAELPPVLLLGALMGLPMVVANVAASAMLQLKTPDRYRGRVYGALGTSNALVGVLVTTAAALIGDRVAAVPMLTLAGILTLMAGMVALALPHSSEESPSTLPLGRE
ncbi:MFS transporter [Deinococcus hopiensis]|uniref:Predicted arabinose efflux permease, MFS family n=1 Tax=Deinococcus hopiensis KR-140 TaxID=695939 RepID=A0A1W1URU9_9DEIO|nr:MFS transporter [Deinococcus hopiensis]SMB83786.1 Predicted arabinose efflux permease, MFS family [Deinococcus hopiensis KR-140]